MKSKNKKKEEKLKTKADMFRRNGPVQSHWSQSWKRKESSPNPLIIYENTATVDIMTLFPRGSSASLDESH